MRSLFPALLLTGLLLTDLASTALAAPEQREGWKATSEISAERPGERQARAAILRGGLLVALRCHRDEQASGETLLIGATWFVKPKARLLFTLAVDDGEPITLQFLRETDYRFAAAAPPRAVIESLMSGKALTLAGPDFASGPVTLPLAGSRAALEAAFATCGYDPLAE